MNLLDLLLVFGLVAAAARGFRHGALSQLAAFGGAAAGLLAGAAIAPDVAGLLVSQPGPTLVLATLGVLLGCVVLGQAIGFALGGRLRLAAARIGVAPADRTAGMAIGVAGLVITVWLAAAALSHGPSPLVAQQVRTSRTVQAIASALPAPPDLVTRVGTYLDRHGFPQVFSGIGGGTIAPPVDPPANDAVAAAAAVGQPSTVQIEATGCGGLSFGSGFVTTPGFVVTNAHVIAGAELLAVRDREGAHDATLVHFDPATDLAVLAAPTLQSPALPWASTPAERGTGGVTLGFPGGQRIMDVKPAAVRGRGTAVGRDIYGRDPVAREILTLSAPVRRGDSGGPFVTATGEVGGVVFAASSSEPGTGYALAAESVRPAVQEAVERNQPAATGPCRF